MHHLFLRHVQNNDPSVIWFIEGKESFRFSVDEFYLITGLKGHCDKEHEIPDDNNLIETYFLDMAMPKLKHGCIKHEELKYFFLSCRVKQDKIKLGVAYLVEYFIMGNRPEKLIKLDTLRLMTDVKSFNEHPWPEKEFECLS